MALTFRGGFCQVFIYKDGVRWDVSNAPYLFNSIASVRAKVMLGGASTIEVSITPSLSDGLDILASGLLGVGISSFGQKPKDVSGGSGATKVTAKSTSSQVSAPSLTPSGVLLSSSAPFLAVKFSYPGDTEADGSPAETGWFAGILSPPDLDLGVGDMSMTLHALGQEGLLTAVEGAMVFKNESALSVLETLVESIGMEIVFDDDDSETEGILEKKIINSISNETPWNSIRSILYSVDCEFVATMGDSKSPSKQLLVRSRKNLNEGKIDFTFVMYRDIDPENNIIPIYNLKLNTVGELFFRGSVFGSDQSLVDTSTKKIERVVIGPKEFDVTSMSPAGDTGGSVPMDTGDGSEVGGGTGHKKLKPGQAGRSDNLQKRKDASNEDSATGSMKNSIASYISYGLTVPGLPRLRPMSVCQLKIGDDIKGLSGPGMLSTLEHVWDSGGWTSEVSLQFTGSATSAHNLSSFNNRKPEVMERPTAGVSKAAVSIS